MNTLKAKTKIRCNTCCCWMNRVKSIKVAALDIEAAKIEAREKVAAWHASLNGQNCRVCQSIINDVEAGK